MGARPRAAAPLTDAGLTPHHAVSLVRERLTPGSAAVVLGAGGLGHLGIQVLRAITDCEVIALDPKAEARDLSLRSGAHHAVAFGPDAAAEISQAAGPHEVAAVLDFVGTDETLGLGANVLGSDGHLVIVGIAGGTISVNWYGVPRGFRLSTTYWGSLPELHQVLMLAARGDLRAETTRFSLKDAPRAYAALRAGTLTGRAVVTPNT